jgi:hypothetical protein
VKRISKIALFTTFAAVCVLGWQLTVRTQSLTYNSGQDVSPAYEGWEQNDDGSFNLLFGYMNRNWQEEIDVPIGPENNMEPGGPDQGQPSHLLPRRNRFVFRVHVPKDFGQKELVWTLTTHGKVNKAYASLKTDLRIENIDIMSETGALGAGTSNPEIRADKPPVIKIDGEKTRTAKVGEPIALTAIVTDDGVPRARGLGGVFAGRGGAGAGRGPVVPSPPARITVGKSLGLHAAWEVYRGAGQVTFTPDQIETWEDTREGANSPWAPRWSAPAAPADGKWTAQATFSEPGTYVMRVVADDGALFSTDDVTVKVSK